MNSPALRNIIPFFDRVHQLIVVVADGWDNTNAILRLYSWQGSKWVLDQGPWHTVLGKNGLAWGRGLYPAANLQPEKTEGDLRAPAGIFSLGKAFGYASEAPFSWPYIPLKN